MTNVSGRSVPDGLSQAEPKVSALRASIPSAERCYWCREPKVVSFYQGKPVPRCSCAVDFRTPVEKRRDAVLDRYGDDPAAYTPAILKELAEQGIFDMTTAFCPAGRLTMAETLAREASGIEVDTKVMTKGSPDYPDRPLGPQFKDLSEAYSGFPMLRAELASGIAARSDETPESGSAEGKSPAPEGDAR